MKNIVVALSACALFSCQEPVNNTVIISGTITDPLSETASIISEDRSNTYTDSLDNEAASEIVFEMDSPAYMSFKHGQETTAMYVKPGNKINLSINPSEFDETISYDGSKASNFLANLQFSLSLVLRSFLANSSIGSFSPQFEGEAITRLLPIP
jgi:hypothetical protein